ncbi:hypothetical protein PoB_001016700 [Plakobranchus ocellatus]|uniref:Uncharacterized protein n=1 Tax=Plakobranchus ocellatus TaxID=259542 RepID=A0AAV3YNG4_9GAST|nr:hypothetical protein PoB_001016700 [Plakobranchus ocellatus]
MVYGALSHGVSNRNRPCSMEIKRTQWPPGSLFLLLPIPVTEELISGFSPPSGYGSLQLIFAPIVYGALSHGVSNHNRPCSMEIKRIQWSPGSLFLLLPIPVTEEVKNEKMMTSPHTKRATNQYDLG